MELGSKQVDAGKDQMGVQVGPAAQCLEWDSELLLPLKLTDVQELLNRSPFSSPEHFLVGLLLQ